MEMQVSSVSSVKQVRTMEMLRNGNASEQCFFSKAGQDHGDAEEWKWKRAVSLQETKSRSECTYTMKDTAEFLLQKRGHRKALRPPQSNEGANRPVAQLLWKLGGWKWCRMVRFICQQALGRYVVGIRSNG